MLSELVIEDVKQSSGPEVVDGSTVSVLYRVALSREDLANDRCVESTFAPDLPITIAVDAESLLPGIYRGVLGMRGGSLRRLVIPSRLAFGGQGYGPVPPDSDLFVELVVVAVDPGSR